ncbi:MAG: PDZ domain-containing protein, partial [Gemmatimonadales bacterium]
MAFLSPAERRSVLDKVLAVIDAKFMGPAPDTKALRTKHGDVVTGADAREAFEAAVNTLLKDLGASHTGFFHESTPRAAGRIAIAATFTQADTTDGHRWVFQDVHPGGAAAAAGIRPGDVLLTIGDKEFIPPEATPFALGERYVVTVRRPDGSTSTPTLSVPTSKDKQRPLVVPD